MKYKKFPNYIQLDSKDCGPTCIKIISKFYGKNFNIQKLRELSETDREGTSLLGLSECAESIGFKTIAVQLSLNQLLDAEKPCVLHWNSNHYVVLYKIERKSKKVFISDPAFGLLEYNYHDFLDRWIGKNSNEDTEEGIALLLDVTPKFYIKETELDLDEETKFGFIYLSKYLIKYKAFIIQLLIGLFTGSILQLIFPFLTQSIVDVGILNQNMHFIWLILIAQLFLFLGKTALEFFRSWILLHLSTRINITLISDFFIKLMNLPISFFDVRMTGDIMQRINDHSRIERLLTTSSLSIIFNIFNVIMMGLVLAYYNIIIFLIFSFGSILYLLWILIFLKKREELDYRRFSEMSKEQSKVIELINGMTEIKLHNAEKQKRWGWEYIQARLFKVSIKGLVLEQYQNIGSNFINELKNIFIIFFSAKFVIEGELTLGMMMAITSIVGGLNTPITQFVSFIREFQDTKISLKRLSEIHNKNDENDKNKNYYINIPDKGDIVFKNVSFRYIGTEKNILNNLNFSIPKNKVTAIVGSSGSGKTTLMKLLLKFYDPSEGNIYYDSINLNSIHPKTWRNHIGSVMQEGYIFNDTIAGNIAIGENIVDKEKLLYASKLANIKSFVDNLPLGFNTVCLQTNLDTFL